jgi:hypothetical protein
VIVRIEPMETQFVVLTMIPSDKASRYT